MQFSPIIIKKHELNQSRSVFMQQLRNRTREPYFDNRSNRRLDIDDPEGTVYADEYDNLVSLRNEVMNKHWILFKTLILFGNRNKNHFWTISYPGHYAFALTMVTICLIIAGIYFIYLKTDYFIFPLSITFYILITYMSRNDYKIHQDLIKTCNSMS